MGRSIIKCAHAGPNAKGTIQHAPGAKLHDRGDIASENLLLKACGRVLALCRVLLFFKSQESGRERFYNLKVLYGNGCSGLYEYSYTDRD